MAPRDACAEFFALRGSVWDVVDLEGSTIHSSESSALPPPRNWFAINDIYLITYPYTSDFLGFYSVSGVRNGPHGQRRPGGTKTSAPRVGQYRLLSSETVGLYLVGFTQECI